MQKQDEENLKGSETMMHLVLAKRYAIIVFGILLSACGASSNDPNPTITPDITNSPTPPPSQQTQNIPPVVDAGQNIDALVGDPVVFDTISYSDPDGQIVSVQWSDAAIAGDPPTRLFDQAGSYTITLTVTDDDNASTSDNVIVNVTSIPNRSPVAIAGQDINASSSDILTFDGSNSYDLDGDIMSWAWYIDDQTEAFSTYETFNSQFSTPGDYRVRLVVMDDLNATAVDTITVKISDAPSNQNPVAIAGDDISVQVGQSFTLDGSSSFDPDGTITRHEWDNGSIGETITHSYGTPGLYTLTLTVTDNLNATASDSVTITVTSVQKLQTPSNVSVIGSSDSEIQLRWQDNANAETAYHVLRRADDATTFTRVGNLAANTTSFSDTNLTANTTYHYQIIAVGNGNDSDPAEISATTEEVSEITEVRIVSGQDLTMIAEEQRQVVAIGVQELGAQELGSQNDEIVGLTNTVEWRSSDPSVAQVSDSGLITAGSQEGSTQITASINNLTYSITVTNLGDGHYVYVNKPNDWDSANIYIWTIENGTETVRSSGWPGNAMEIALDLGGNWYRYPVLSSWANSSGDTAVIFNCGSDQCQTENLSVTNTRAYWYEDDNWLSNAPNGAGAFLEGTQIQIGKGEVFLSNNGENLSGRLFNEGVVLDVVANEPPRGDRFAGWSGSGVPYLVDANSPNTELVVDDALSFTVLALYERIVDDHELGRQYYTDTNLNCSGCHGSDGSALQGGNTLLTIQDRFNSMEALASYIETDMPMFSESNCVGECASTTAALIWENAFLPPEGACDAENLDDLVPMDRNVRLLTTLEYNNSVRDLLRLNQDIDVTTGRIPADIPVNGFKTYASSTFTNDYAKGYITAAETAAALVDNIFSIEPQCSGDIQCFIRDFGKRAFRRPIVQAELNDLINLHEEEGELGLLAGILSSPFMLYRSELGEAQSNGYYELTDYEVATLLSYTYWATTPDDALLAIADAGGLSTTENIANQVETMLADERAEVAFERFIKGWLNLDKDIKSSDLDETLKQDMTEETLRFVKNIVFNGGSYEELITADYSIMNQNLANHYGLNWPGGSAQWQQVQYTGTGNSERRGVMGHAGILARQSASEKTHPVKRGLFVRRSLLCQDFPPPPIGANLNPISDPSHTVRERFEIAHSADGCESCHQHIDGIGFGFENYDSYGLWQDFEMVEVNGVATQKPIDATGSIGSLYAAETQLSATEINIPYSGMNELMDLIAESPNSKACYARQWFRYSYGKLEESEDNCTLQVFGDEFKHSNNVSLLELMVQHVKTKNYILRK